MGRLFPVLWIVLATPAIALQPSQMTDDQVRQAIIQNSINDYHSTGRPCACPYDLDRAGHSCGGRSADPVGRRRCAIPRT